MTTTAADTYYALRMRFQGMRLRMPSFLTAARRSLWETQRDLLVEELERRQRVSRLQGKPWHHGAMTSLMARLACPYQFSPSDSPEGDEVIPASGVQATRDWRAAAGA